MSKVSELKWKLYEMKTSILYSYGLKNGLIHPYETELIEKLRHVYYGALPVSIILLCDKMCNGFCYDRAPLITLGFGDDDFKIINADVDSIRLRPAEIEKYGNNPHFANHCFAERTKEDGTVWVYDTSIGLVTEKSLYYKMENPQITSIRDKEATLTFLENFKINKDDLGEDKYALPLILPSYEAISEMSSHFYANDLKEEIERFKDEIDYESICAEVQDDMKIKCFKK